MSHTENCIVCYDAVIDVDDGINILIDHWNLDHIYICDACFYSFKKYTKY